MTIILFWSRGRTLQGEEFSWDIYKTIYDCDDHINNLLLIVFSLRFQTLYLKAAIIDKGDNVDP